LNEPKNMIERLPKWLRDDKLANVINNVMEGSKIKSHDTDLKNLPQQPIQVWREHNVTTPKSTTKTATSSPDMTVIVNNGYLPVMPKFDIEANGLSNFILGANGRNISFTGEITGTATIFPSCKINENGESVVIPNIIINGIDVSNEISGSYPICDGETTLVSSGSGLSAPTTRIYFDEFTSFDIYIKVKTIKDYPLKKVTLYDEENNVLGAKEYLENDVIRSDLVKIENQTCDKFYAEIEYYGIGSSVKVGFPQSTSNVDPTYQINEQLTNNVKEVGMFRRNYRTDLQIPEYWNTYPVGYPFSEEQDYWLEKRYLSEYTKMYPEHGLLLSEINSYLNVIPEVIDMSKDSLIWDVRTWDEFVWGDGEDNQPGVFGVDIPYNEIPSNVIKLSSIEIQRIIDRCKKFGTKGIAWYSEDVDWSLGFSLVTQIEMTVNADEFLMGLLFDNEDTLYTKPFSIQLGMLDTEWETTTGITLGTELDFSVVSYEIKKLLYLDSDASTSYTNILNVNQANGGEDGTTTGFVPFSGAAISNSTTWAYQGTHSIKAITTGQPGGIETTPKSATANTHYTGQLRLKGSGTYYVGLRSLNVNSVEQGNTTTSITISGDATVFVSHFTPANTTQITMFAYDPVWHSALLYVDKLQINKGLTAYPWIVGLTSSTAPVSSFALCNLNVATIPSDASIVAAASGSFTTPTVAPAADQSAWSRLTHTATIPSGCSILYDVYTEVLDQSQSLSDLEFETGLYKFSQSFTPTGDKIGKIKIKTGMVYDSPTNNITATLYKSDSNSEPTGSALATYTILKRNWLRESEIELNFGVIENLQPGEYVFVLDFTTNTPQSSLFYLKGTRTNGTVGTSKFLTPAGTWMTTNNHMYFKQYTPTKVLGDKTAPIDLNGINNFPLFAKGKITKTGVTSVQVDEVIISYDKQI